MVESFGYFFGFIFITLLISDFVYLLIYRRSWRFVMVAIVVIFSMITFVNMNQTHSFGDIGLEIIAIVICGPVLLVTVLWSAYHSMCDLVSAAKSGQMMNPKNFFRFSPVVLLPTLIASGIVLTLIDK